ncbi:MAG: Sir2 family NAD-dependent protein deacetylase [Nitriliruptoraceae bacterium]
MSDDAVIDAVSGWVRAATSVVALTGAGVSTGSGIPDFRGPDGVWTRDPAAERLSDITHYVRDADVRREAWRRRIAVVESSTGPNAAHRAFADLEAAGHLELLITQNVDGLHRAAGSEPNHVVEIHGTASEVLCLDCGDRMAADVVYARIRAGDDDPHCNECGGVLKSATVSFGQALDPHAIDRAATASARAEVFLAVGTSLGVHPAASLPALALEGGGRLVIINQQPTPYDGRAAAVIRADTGATMTAIVDRVTSAN